MSRIPDAEIGFHPHSHGDPAGRLFQWNGKLYRGIRAPWIPVWTQLVEGGVLQHLVQRGLLIETEPTNLELDGFELVVRHRRVPFASYPEEWCAAMLKDAARAILDLAVELAPAGMTLKDGHPWNVMFDAGKFIYVDLTSLTPMPRGGGWPGHDSFCRFCLYPLLLMAHGQDRIARRLLPEPDGILQSDVELLTGTLPPFVGYPPIFQRLRSAWERRVPASFRTLLPGALDRFVPRLTSSRTSVGLGYLLRLRERIDRLALPENGPGGPANGLAASPEAIPGGLRDSVQRVLTELRGDSVLVVGENLGWCCRLAARLGKRVVSLDTDPGRVTQLYHEARADKLQVLPLLMGLDDPTPARGLFGHWAIAANDRFKCDLVIALNLVHHMVFKRHLDFAHIAGGLGLFSKRWLLVEFVEPTIQQLASAETVRSYTGEAFVAALKREFRTVTALPAFEQGRVLFHCEK